MKFICEQQIFSKSLSTVMKAVYTRTTMPILKCVYIEAVGNKIILKCSDTEISIEKYFDAKVIESGSLAVPAKTLSDIIRKMNKEEIEFSVQNDSLIIKGSISKFSLRGYRTEDFPKTAEINLKEGELNFGAEEIKELIRKTSIFASSDESNGIYTGILLDIKNEKINFVATDKYRLGIATEKQKNNLEKEIIIPTKTFNDLRKIIQEEDIENEIRVEIGENRVIFYLEKIKFVSRLLEGKYIRYESIIPNQKDIEVKIKRTDFLSAIDRASIFGKDGNNSIISCNFEGNILNITSFSEEGGAKEKVEILKTGDDIEIRFNSRYLSEAFSTIDDEYIKLYLSEKFCIIKPLKGENFIFCITGLKQIKR